MVAVNRFLRGHPRLSIALPLACLLAEFGVWDLSSGYRGQLVAHIDLARGHYKTLFFGLPTSSRPEYIRLLRERYGIELQVVAGCVVSQSLFAYAMGYNTVSMNAANRKFGRDVFRETAIAAGRNWRNRAAPRLGPD
jgi:hypothetical protein